MLLLCKCGCLDQTKQAFSVFKKFSYFPRNSLTKCKMCMSLDCPKVTPQIRSRYMIWRDYRSLDRKDKTSNLRTGNVILLNLLSTETDLKLQIIFKMVVNVFNLTSLSSSTREQRNWQSIRLLLSWCVKSDMVSGCGVLLHMLTFL